MKVVTTFHPSSSVVSSLKCHLTPDTSLEHLVVAKINRIDVFSTRPEGLKHECGVDIWGRISALKTVASTDSRDNLLLLTDHPDPKLILLTSRTSKTGGLLLELAQTIELYERNARPAEFLQDVVVNESGRVAIASCYAGKLRAIILKGDRVDVDFDVAVPEFSVLSLAFISSRSGIHALAILHLDHNQQVQLLSRDLDVSAFELSPTPSLLLPPTPLPTAAYPFTDSPPILINVPSIESVSFDDDDDSVFSGGVLVVGGRKIQLFPFASKDWQDKYRGKQRRLESKKKSKDERLSSLAKEKEKDRETKKRKAKANVDWPWSEVTAWCPVSETGTSYIIGDAYGQLALLSLDRLQDQGLILLPLGQVSPPTTLTYLSSQIFYLGSHFGDSQLIRVHSSPFSALKLPTLLIAPSVVTVSPDFLTSNDKGKGRAGVDSRKDIGRVVRSQGNFLEVMNTWKNIAPIMDAVLADTDGSGHSNIVTCSGGKNAGSLRVIRNGADFHEQAHIEGFHDVTGLWSIRPTFKDSQDSHIIVSDGQQSSVFRLNNAETVTRIDPLVAGFITKSPTLAVNNLARRTKKPGTTSSTYEDSPLVVQVTPKRVVLVEYDAILDVHRVVSEWAPSEQGVTWSGREIVLASVNSSQIVLALKGGRVAVLNLNEEGGLNLAGDRDLDGEIAAISCSPINHSDPFSRYVIVGFWAPHRVEILSLISKNDHLGRVCDPVHVPSLPRSLLLLGFVPPHAPTSSEYLSHLLIGLGDGTLVSYSYQDQQLRDKKTMSLGYSPVSLVRSQVDGRSTVLALGTTAAMLFWGKERLQRSPILLKDASAASVVNTAWWQSCLVAATSSGLVIGRVRDLDKMHIRSIPLGLDNPRRLAYSPTLKTFGVGCVRTEPGRVGDAEMMTSSFKVLDDTTFQVLGQFTCEMHHEVTAIHNVIVKDGDSHWCLGTANFDPAEKEPSQGRLYVFSMNDRSSAHIALETVASIDVPGCIYQLSSIDGFIVAAVNSSVVIYRLEAGDNPSLTKVCEWNHNYLVMSLATHGSRLIVGDAISSVSILSFQDDILTTVARDYGPLWPVAVEAWGEEGVVGANSDCNLFTFSIQRSEQRTVLYRDGHYHFDDLVNKIVLGAIHSSDAAEDAIESKALIFTASGQIGVLLDMGEELSLQMSSVQRNLSKVVTDVAGARHTRWRTPAGGRERTDADEAAYGFLDGDFLEQFMNYPETSREMEQIMSGENEAEKLMQKYAHIRRILETLQGMH